jgi:hypothetical protein
MKKDCCKDECRQIKVQDDQKVTGKCSTNFISLKKLDKPGFELKADKIHAVDVSLNLKSCNSPPVLLNDVLLHRYCILRI